VGAAKKRGAPPARFRHVSRGPNHGDPTDRLMVQVFNAVIEIAEAGKIAN
jgi:hypothetical protein